MSSRFLRKHWGVIEDLHLKWAQKEFNSKFSEENALRKGRAGVHCQEEALLKCSQAERNVKVTWSLFSASERTCQKLFASDSIDSPFLWFSPMILFCRLIASMNYYS